MRLSRMGVVVVVGAVLLSACAGGDDSVGDATTTDAVPEATTSVVTTTSVPASSTSESTTTTAVRTTTVSAEVLVAQVHTRVLTELSDIDERVEGPEASLPLAEELTTGQFLERLRASVEADVATGERIVGGYESNIVEVVVSGATATVLDCSRDASELYSSDGTLLVPADDFFKLRRSVLVLIDGTWFMQELYTGGDERCDPADSQ